MTRSKIVMMSCFGMAMICAIAMFPITSQLVSLGPDALDSDAYHSKWLVDCILGIVGLVSAVTGKRLSSEIDRDR